jgi:hypothetical protein
MKDTFMMLNLIFLHRLVIKYIKVAEACRQILSPVIAEALVNTAYFCMIRHHVAKKDI